MRHNPMLQAEATFDAFTAADPGAFAEVNAAAAESGDGTPSRPKVSGMAYSGGTLSVSWTLPVVVDLAGLRASESIVLLMDHDRRMLVGQAVAAINSRNIKITGTITGDTEDTNDPSHKVAVHARGGFKWPLSIGVWPEKVEEVAAGVKVNVNGRSFTGPLFVVRAGVLRETSFTSIGGDEHASADVAAAAAGDTNMEPTFEQWLTAQGKDISKLADEDKGKLQAAYDGLKAAGVLKASYDAMVKAAGSPAPTPTPTPSPAPSVQAGGDDRIARQGLEAAAEYERMDMVARLAGTKYPALAAKAITEKWDEARLTAEIKIVDLQQSRPKAPAVHAAGEVTMTAEICEAALCAAGRLAKPESHFAEQTLEAAGKLGRIGLQETIMLIASMNGWNGRMTASSFRSNHKAILVAAFGASTIDISGILSNVANKFLMDSFNTVESVWRRITSIVPATDFKTMTRYRLTSGGGYQKVAPDGELKHGTLGEESYTNKVDTYGKILNITRVDQINDDMGAITKVPAQLGGDAGRALNVIFWAAFQDNAAFFTAARGNLVAGAGRPFYLLVDPAKGGDNMATMEVAFLDGRDMPVVETAEADFNKLGIQMRSYHDWGVAKAEYRGGVRSSTALSLDSLESANKLFLDQKINATDPLGILPNILLVATGDQVLARQIFNSQELRNTTANKKEVVGNPFQGSFEPLCSAYLANA